jgi:hypothetical protein
MEPLIKSTVRAAHGAACRCLPRMANHRHLLETTPIIGRFSQGRVVDLRTCASAVTSSLTCFATICRVPPGLGFPRALRPPSLPSGWMNPAYLSGSRTATIASDLLVKQCARPVPHLCSSAAFWSASLSPCSFFPRLTGFGSASGRSNSPAMGRSIIRCAMRAPESRPVCPG